MELAQRQFMRYGVNALLCIEVEADDEWRCTLRYGVNTYLEPLGVSRYGVYRRVQAV